MFCSKTTIFVRQSVIWKNARFCAWLWGGTLIGQKWCTLFCAQVQQNKTKEKTLKPLFFCNKLAFVVKQQKPDLIQKTKNKTLIVHIGVFGVLMLVMFQEFTGDVWKKHYYPASFEAFCSCFLNPFFLMLAFGFVDFVLGFFFTSSCCCLINQVAMFWFRFLLFWVSLVFLLCVIFWIVFVIFDFCFVLEGFRVRWGGPKGHLTWPWTLLICFILFLVSFLIVLFLLGFVVSFVFAFGFLEGFKGQVGLRKGPPHLAINPAYLFFFGFGLFLFVLEWTKTLFPPGKGFFVHLFSVELPFSISLSLSFFLSCFVCFLSFFLAFFASFFLFFLPLFLSFDGLLFCLQYHRCAHVPFNYVFGFKQKGPNSPRYGKT